MTVLDARAPLVVDTRDLGRRPGSSLPVRREVPAPADLGGEIIGVEKGSPLVFDLLLEAVMEGVLVSGTVSGRVTGECVRCLDPIDSRFVVRLQELYVYDGVSSAEDEDVRAMVGDRFDLEPALRDALIPTLPFQPVCRDDCAGLPTQYGVPDEPVPEGAEPTDDLDPRWAVLSRLAGQSPAERQD